MLEGGEEAQEDDQTAFTARTAHVAARLKVDYASLPNRKCALLRCSAGQTMPATFPLFIAPCCLKLDFSTLAKWLRCVACGQHRWVSCHWPSL